MYLALGIDQLDRVQQLPTFFAMVAARGVIAAPLHGAGALDEPVRRDPLARAAVELLGRLLREPAVVQQPPEHALADLRLLRRRRAAEVVEADAEPPVHLPVEGVEAVADLPRRAPLLERPGLRGDAVLVGAADEEHVVAPEAAVARVRVGAEHAADEVAQVRHVAHVRRARSADPPPAALPPQPSLPCPGADCLARWPCTSSRCRAAASCVPAVPDWSLCIYRPLVTIQRSLVSSRLSMTYSCSPI